MSSNSRTRNKSSVLFVLLFIIIFSLFSNLTHVIVPIVMMQVYNRVLPSESVSTLIFIAFIAVFLITCLSVVEYLRGRVLVELGDYLYRRCFSNVVGNASFAAPLMPAGSGIRSVLRLENLRHFPAAQSTLLLLDCLWLPVLLLGLFLLHFLAGLIALLGAAIVFTVSYLVGGTPPGLYERKEDNIGAASDYIQAVLRCEEVFLANGSIGNCMQRAKELLDAGEPQRRRQRINAVVGRSVLRGVKLTTQMVVLLSAAWLAIEDRISGGAIIAMSLLTQRFLQPIDQVWPSLQKAKDALSYRRRIEAEYHTNLAPGGDAADAVKDGSIELSSVSVFVNRKKASLRNVSIVVPTGSSLCIVGAAGAGKTLLLRVILGLAHTVSGEVRVGGSDICALDDKERTRTFGYLPQDDLLIDGTIRDNIASYETGSTTKVVQTALRLGIDGLIRGMPNGYDTVVGKGGAVPAGIARLVALARATHCRPRVMLFDDPTQRMDKYGKHVFIGLMRMLRREGVTVVVVSEDSAVFAEVDSFLVLRKGYVCFHGSRVEAVAYQKEAMSRAIRKPSQQIRPAG